MSGQGLSNPDKALWPGVSKRDLRAYYEAVADRLLPQLRDRPLTLLRHPNGVGQSGFFQKDTPAHAPASLRRHDAWSDSAGKTVSYVVASTVEDLRWFAQVAAVELHPGLARIDRPDRPDTLVLDLDPADHSVSPVQAALWVREVLDELELTSRVKTSGKSGLHVLLPIERRYSFEQVRGLSLAIGRATADRHPDELTVEMRKRRRAGRLLLDWSRNGRSQTVVAAWSPRATTGAAVAVPLAWDEVKPSLDPSAFTVKTAVQRADCWADDGLRAQRLDRAARALRYAGYDPVDADPRSSAGIG